MNTKQVKKVYQHLINIDLEELQKLVPIVKEYHNILNQLDCQTIEDFELKVNDKTGFVNTIMSASALGFENQYKRLLELKKEINSKLSISDITATNQLESGLITEIKEKHTAYFTPSELKVKENLDKVIKIYNSLDYKNRKEIGFNLSGELSYSPFSEYRGQST